MVGVQKTHGAFFCLAAVIEVLRAAVYEIVREPEPREKLNIAALAFAKDPDGYLVKLIQKSP